MQSNTAIPQHQHQPAGPPAPLSWVMYSNITPAARAAAWLLADIAAQTPAGELPLLDRNFIAFHIGLSRGDKTSKVLDELTAIGFLTIVGRDVDPVTGRRRAPRDQQGRVAISRFTVRLEPPSDHDGACDLVTARTEFAEEYKTAFLAAKAAGRVPRRGHLAVRRSAARSQRVAQQGRPFVYVIGSAGTGRVKIGFSTDVMRRLRDLQASSPVLLRVLWFGNGSREIEERLHLRFHTYRTHGEWFEFNQRSDPATAIRAEALRLGATEVTA